MLRARLFAFVAIVSAAAASTLPAQNPPIAFQQFGDLQKEFSTARSFEIIARTREGIPAAVRVTLQSGEKQIFALAGFMGYADAWAKGMGLPGVPANYQVDHVYPENSALGTSKKAFQERLRNWRTRYDAWEKGGRVGRAPVRPKPKNYQWLRIEAIHEDVNGQVGRLWEQRTARLRGETLVFPVRRASPFERLKLDAAYGQPPSKIRIPVWKQVLNEKKRLEFVSLKEFQLIQSERAAAKALKIGGAFFAGVPSALDARELAAATNKFKNSGIYRQTERLLADGRYDEARRLWLEKCATPDDSKRHEDCVEYQQALARLTGLMGTKTHEDLPAAMRGYYELLEEEARDLAQAAEALEETKQPESAPAVPERVAFERLPANTPIRLDVERGDTEFLVGSDALLNVRAYAALMNAWVPLTNAPVQVRKANATVANGRTDAYGNTPLSFRAPSEIGEHQYVVEIAGRVSQAAWVWTYGYKVVLDGDSSPDTHPARADGVDAVPARIRLVKRSARGTDGQQAPAAAGDDVQSLFVFESTSNADYPTLRIGTSAEPRSDAGRGVHVTPTGDGSVALSFVAQRPGLRTVEVHARGGRFTTLNPSSTKLGEFQVRFDPTMPGLMLEWGTPPQGGRVTGDRLTLDLKAGSVDPRELLVHAITRRTGTPVPVSDVRLDFAVRPAESVELYRATDAKTDAAGLARSTDGKLPAIYSPLPGKATVTISADGSANSLTVEIAAVDEDAGPNIALEIDQVQSVVDLRQTRTGTVSGRLVQDGRGVPLPERYSLEVEGLNGAVLSAEARYVVRPAYWGSSNKQSRYLELRTDADGRFEFNVGAPEHQRQELRVRLWDKTRSEYVSTLDARIDFIDPTGARRVVARGPFSTVYMQENTLTTQPPAALTSEIPSGKGRLYAVVLDAAGEDMPIFRSVLRPGTQDEVAYWYGGALDIEPGEYDIQVSLEVPQTHRVRVRAGQVETLRIAGLGRLAFEPRNGIDETIDPYISVRRSGTDTELSYSFGRSMELPAGTYDVVFSYLPEVRHDVVVVKAYHTTTVEASGYGRLEFEALNGINEKFEPYISIRRAGQREELTYTFGRAVDLPPGEYDVVFSYSPEVTVRAIVTAKHATPLRVSGYGRITFDVLNALGQPVETHMSVRRLNAAEELTSTSGMPVDVPPGAYHVVFNDGDEEIKVVVNVSAGRATPARVRLRR